MVNSKDFTDRLGKILDYYSLSASSFAEKIGVQRSSISHILSGRNKPSLEFIMKVLSSFPEVDLYWLLKGKGKFPSQISTEKIKPDDSSALSSPESFMNLPETSTRSDSQIERIVIFYKDGSFKNFENS